MDKQLMKMHQTIFSVNQNTSTNGVKSIFESSQLIFKFFLPWVLQFFNNITNNWWNQGISHCVTYRIFLWLAQDIYKTYVLYLLKVWFSGSWLCIMLLGNSEDDLYGYFCDLLLLMMLLENATLDSPNSLFQECRKNIPSSDLPWKYSNIVF